MKDRVVYSSIAKFPEESNGSLIIATNKKINVTVGGTDFAGKMNLGGYAALHLKDLRLLVLALKENIELKKENAELKKEIKND